MPPGNPTTGVPLRHRRSGSESLADHYLIRPTTPADLEALEALEAIAFSDPWNRAMLEEALISRGAVAMVAEIDGRIVGSVMARSVAAEGEILSLSVDPTRRRAGLGRELLAAAVAALRDHGVVDVWLEVRASNHAAISLYQQAGFVAAGIRRGYYRRPTEDAVVLRLDLSASRGAGQGGSGT